MLFCTQERSLYKMIDGVDVCCSFLLRLSGPVLMAAANALIGLVTNVYINTILPRYVRPRLGIAAYTTARG